MDLSELTDEQLEEELDRRRRDKVRNMAVEAQGTLASLVRQLADLAAEVSGYDLYLQSRVGAELERVFEDHS